MAALSGILIMSLPPNFVPLRLDYGETSVDPILDRILVLASGKKVGVARPHLRLWTNGDCRPAD